MKVSQLKLAFVALLAAFVAMQYAQGVCFYMSDEGCPGTDSTCPETMSCTYQSFGGEGGTIIRGFVPFYVDQTTDQGYGGWTLNTDAKASCHCIYGVYDESSVFSTYFCTLATFQGSWDGSYGSAPCNP